MRSDPELKLAPKARKVSFGGRRLLPSALFSLFLAAVAYLLAACASPSAAPVDDESVSTADPGVSWALAVHGGAGVTRASMEGRDEGAYEESLRNALSVGKKLLAEGGSALDAVEAVVQLLEDDPLFNAGRGSVFTNAGTNEMDAAIMDGRDLSCGAVSGLTTVKNPISVARGVMEQSRHVFMVGEGAEKFADELEVERVEPDYFFVQRRYDSWQRAVEREKAEAASFQGPGGVDDSQGRYGTVGAVAMDQAGNLAAATSTGGMTNKRFGRVGDVPVIGAGTYANNRTCAVSCTGIGEQFIRHTIAGDVSARMEHGGASLEQATQEVIDTVLEPGDGGLIAVGKDGSLSIQFNTEGMFHGVADSSGRLEVGIWKDGQ